MKYSKTKFILRHRWNLLLNLRAYKEFGINGFTREYEYDINNNTYTLSNKVNRVKYNYDNVNRLKDIKLNDNITWENGYDSLSRVSSRKLTSGSSNYTTTYTYDALGNIETIKKGNEVTNQYYYDELNQLVKEINIPESKMITYEYDEGGNILNKKEYLYTAGSETSTPIETITYTYGNTNWRDQLTNYNGKEITYDEIGNIVTYDGNTYIWQNGRQLAGISNSGSTITYKYNDNGIRTQKTVDGTVTNYYLDGNKVIYEKTGNDVIYYTYDETGKIIGLNYNDTQYYYIRNGQNDVIGILDSNLNQVVSYEYDSWGNTISIKDANGNAITSSSNIGIINPYRYRSYRYDTEIGLYYLNSRYYNPEWGRFINADGLVSTGQGLLSHNMYVYCNNSPINTMDENGDTAITITIAYGLTKALIATIGFATGLLVGGAIVDYSREQSQAKAKERVEPITKTKSKPKDVVIYRYGGTNPGNLTPKEKDTDGLSFSTIPKPGSAVTTINTINATGILYAVQDRPFHVIVRPIGASMRDWYKAGADSIWTKTLKSIVIKWDGVM